MGGGNAWAAPEDYLTGWTEVTSLPTDNAQLEQNYYVIVEGDMMVGQGYATAPDTQEGKRTAVYVTPCDPATDSKVVWLLSYSNDFEYGLRNYAFQGRYMQSRGDAPWRLQAEWEANQSRWTRMAFAYANGTWTIQNKGHVESDFGTNYWGSWGEDANRYSNGYCLAGNKGYDGSDTYVGHFKIYSIARSSYAPKTGIYEMPYSTDFASKNPFTGGSVVNGTNVQSVFNVFNTSAEASFNVNNSGTAYTLSENEEVSVSFKAYHGWNGSAADQTISLLNSDGVVLASYTYSLSSSNLTGVTVAGQSQSFSAYNCQSNKGGGNANGLTNNPYVTTDNNNPIFTFVISQSGKCAVNVKYGLKSIDNTYTANVAAGVKLNIAKIVVSCPNNKNNNTDRTICIDNLSITSEIKTTPKADFTIKYVDEEGTEIKAQSAGNDEVGANPVLTGSDKESFVSGEVKYVYASDDASEKTIAADGSTVVTVTFNTLHKLNYSIANSLGTPISNGTAFPDDNVTVAVPRYINVSGTLYETAKNGNDWYRHTYTITSDNQEETVTYNATTIDNIVFYAEAEDLTGATTSAGTVTRTSMGLTGYGTNLPVTTLPAGSYKIYAHTANANEAQRPVAFKNGETPVAEFTMSSKNNNQDHVSEMFTLTESADITLTSGGSSYAGVDYFYIQEIASATMAVNAEAKYGTFCAPFAVDVPSGVEASTATLDGTTIVLTSVAENTIPANTPVILYAESGLDATTFYGKAVNGTPTAGVLTGVYTSTPAVDGWYVLQNNDEGVGFYQVDTKVATPTVGANRAYLTVSAGANVRAFRLDNNANAIEAISAIANNAIEAIYNANGVKVNALQKGINVVKMQNGKTQKVLVK